VEENQKHWFVVHTYSGYEERVRQNLEQRIKFMDAGDKISQVVIPTEEEIEVRNGQRRTVTKKILPSLSHPSASPGDKIDKRLRDR